jgi:hypothetical protein
MVKPDHISGVLMLILCFGCNKGEFITRSHEPEAFTQIVFDSPYEVVFHPADFFRIGIQGHEDFVQAVQFTWADSTLIVKTDARATWMHPEDNKIRLDIFGDSLREIRANETCHISSSDSLHAEELGLVVGSKLNISNLILDCRTFYYYNNFPCSGTMRFSGKVEELKIWNSALMEVDASTCQADYVLVENNSAGNCTVNAQNRIDYRIGGNGDIRVYGQPQVINILGISGDGELILLD